MCPHDKPIPFRCWFCFSASARSRASLTEMVPMHNNVDWVSSRSCSIVLVMPCGNIFFRRVVECPHLPVNEKENGDVVSFYVCYFPRWTMGILHVRHSRWCHRDVQVPQRAPRVMVRSSCRTLSGVAAALRQVGRLHQSIPLILRVFPGKVGISAGHGCVPQSRWLDCPSLRMGWWKCCFDE